MPQGNTSVSLKGKDKSKVTFRQCNKSRTPAFIVLVVLHQEELGLLEVTVH